MNNRLPARLKKIRREMRKNNISHYFVNRLSDIAWLSGYIGTTAYIIIGQDEAYFITDGRYETYAREILDPAWSLEIVERYSDFFNRTGKSFNELFLQPDAPVMLRELFSSAGAIVKVDKNDILLNTRAVKDADEIALLREEYSLAGTAFLSALEEWRYGETEKSWAATLEYKMKQNGANGPSFDTIIASGVRGALPHGTASDKIIGADEAVTVDFGSKRLYTSDYTRVVYGGKDKEILTVIDIVKDAISLAIDAVKVGVNCSDVDKAARGYIEKKGYGSYFNHGLGHGVGADVHENPRIGSKSADVIEEGMVFTIEPGIYLPGKFGVRLEETVLVRKIGCEKLSSVLDKYVYTLN